MEEKKEALLGITPQGWMQAAVISFAVLFAFFLMISSGHGGGSPALSGEPAATPEFAACLTESGAVFYGTDWCSHCRSQKALFGENFDKVNFINCEESRTLCETAGIEAYPTWIINGEKYLGAKSLEKLGALTGCEVGA